MEERDSNFAILKKALQPNNVSKNEIKESLEKFRLSICLNWYEKFPTSQQETFLTSIWSTLFELLYIDDSDIRMLIFSNIGAIIYTLSPFYPLTLLRTFLKIAPDQPISPATSFGVISSFCHISRYVSPINIEKFVESLPICHHFSADISEYYHYLPRLFHVTVFFNNEFTEALLENLISGCIKPTRDFGSALVEIIVHNPSLLFNSTILDQSNNLKKDRFHSLLKGNEIKQKILIILTYSILKNPKLSSFFPENYLNLVFELCLTYLNLTSDFFEETCSTLSEILDYQSIHFPKSFQTNVEKVQVSISSLSNSISKDKTISLQDDNNIIPHNNKENNNEANNNEANNNEESNNKENIELPIHYQIALYQLADNIIVLGIDYSDSSNVISAKIDGVSKFIRRYPTQHNIIEGISYLDQFVNGIYQHRAKGEVLTRVIDAFAVILSTKTEEQSAKTFLHSILQLDLNWIQCTSLVHVFENLKWNEPSKAPTLIHFAFSQHQDLSTAALNALKQSMNYNTAEIIINSLLQSKNSPDFFLDSSILKFFSLANLVAHFPRANLLFDISVELLIYSTSLSVAGSGFRFLNNFSIFEILHSQNNALNKNHSTTNNNNNNNNININSNIISSTNSNVDVNSQNLNNQKYELLKDNIKTLQIIALD